MSVQNNSALTNAYDLLKECNPSMAEIELQKALSANLENEEIIFALSCANFWKKPMSQIESLSSAFEKGEYLIFHWKAFISFIATKEKTFEPVLYAVRKGVFSLALQYYQALLREPGMKHKNETYCRIGLCYKKLGDYESALKFLIDANNKTPDSAAILAEMADCYAMIGEDKTAKLFFREAFFINPQEIDIYLLESLLITELFMQIRKLGYTENVFLEWVPVYGVLYGVFNVKRGLRAFEFAKLKQSIYTLESELKELVGIAEALIPKLINHYFWLIDYYTITKEDRSKIDEVLLKIKLLDNDIYTKYTI
ncbi:MAG: hypothetical protein GX220_02240 [Treponema sp.]|nr:hypothetical protein [Treponema sp.]